MQELTIDFYQDFKEWLDKRAAEPAGDREIKTYSYGTDEITKGCAIGFDEELFLLYPGNVDMPLHNTLSELHDWINRYCPGAVEVGIAHHLKAAYIAGFKVYWTDNQICFSLPDKKPLPILGDT